jgi:hypothetical protein
MEEIQQSTSEVPHVITEAYQSVPQPPDIPEEAHPSTPEVHPGTPNPEDWELWTTIKAQWQEVETMLADRQALLSTPVGTPGDTPRKTYVFDVRHIALIEAYAQEHRLELKDVIYAACEEFFQRR